MTMRLAGRIAACLIVKDGAATLNRCLRSVRQHVDGTVGLADLLLSTDLALE